MVSLRDCDATSGSSSSNNNNNNNKINVKPYDQHQDNTTPPLQPPSSPPPAPPPLSPCSPRGRGSDTCFSCKRVGHWSRDCPSKTPKLSRSASPALSFLMQICDLPVIRCPCGDGACRVFPSTTEKNPNRKFYSCPISDRSRKCGFFQWCDEVMKHSIPPCPCGAGISSLNRGSSGPHAGHWFFACRIKKNHGACKFYQLIDHKLNSLLNKNLPRVEGYPSHSLGTKQHTLNVASDKRAELISEITVGSPEMQTSESLSNLIIPQTSADNDEFPNQDVVMKESDSWVPVISKGRQICKRISQIEIQLQQRRFLREVSAAGNSLAGELVYQFLAVQFHGWMGRLVFPPCHSLKDPLALSIFWCVFPSFYPFPTLENGNVSEVEGLVTPLGDESDVAMHVPVQLSPEQNDVPSSNTCCDPASIEMSSNVEQEVSISVIILKSLGHGLLKILESMKVYDHKKMLKVAEATFESLRGMEVDCGAFCEGVKEYINCQSRLASMEDTLCKELSPEQLIDEYYIKKAHFDHVSQLHNEEVVAFEVSNKHVQSLCEEVAFLRDMLTQLEKQISDCESETFKLQSGVEEIYAKKMEAEMQMDAASLAMEEALELEKQRELEYATAKATMDRLLGLLKE